MRVCDLTIVHIIVCKPHCSVERRGGKRVSETWREREMQHKKQHYQRRASKTISCVSWVICDPAFFRLQRAAVCWNTASGRVERGERRRDGGGGESDFSNKCWHQACLILDSGNGLICYRLWNSLGRPSERQGRLPHQTPECKRGEQGPIGQLSGYKDDH